MYMFLKLTFEICFRLFFQANGDAEAVVQRCPVKKVFLKISKNSQENNCA